MKKTFLWILVLSIAGIFIAAQGFAQQQGAYGERGYEGRQPAQGYTETAPPAVEFEREPGMAGYGREPYKYYPGGVPEDTTILVPRTSPFSTQGSGMEVIERGDSERYEEQGGRSRAPSGYYEGSDVRSPQAARPYDQRSYEYYEDTRGRQPARGYYDMPRGQERGRESYDYYRGGAAEDRRVLTPRTSPFATQGSGAEVIDRGSQQGYEEQQMRSPSAPGYYGDQYREDRMGGQRGYYYGQ